jgi:Zn-dependent peptidase ImmA (M78 family)
MKRLAVEDALNFAEQNFPFGPEKLAEFLDIKVRLSACKGDGYCLRYRDQTLIRLNSAAPSKRRRFTLAHELGHLLLGTPSVVGEVFDEAPQNLSQEEKRVNEIAGQLLLPLNVAKNGIRRLPISRKVIEKLAEKANVSPVFLVRRLTALSSELGLLGAATLHYENQRYQWGYGSRVNDVARSADKLLTQCLAYQDANFKIVRIEHGDVLCAVLLSNPHLSSQTVFSQVLRRNDDTAESLELTTSFLEARLLLGYESLKPSLEGCMSSMKGRVAQLSNEEALTLFSGRYLKSPTRWPEEFCARLRTADGQRYLQLRLEIWTQRDE